jgi:hypothetical protein
MPRDGMKRALAVLRIVLHQPSIFDTGQDLSGE